MENNRRSQRVLKHCHQINNIFHNQNGDSILLSHLPPCLLSLISRTNSISCENVSQLPILTMSEDTHKAIFQAEGASNYQQKWIVQLEEQIKNTGRNVSHDHNQISLSSQLQPKKGNIKVEARSNKSKKIGIFKDQQFLQRLNLFIMGETYDIFTATSKQ